MKRPLWLVSAVLAVATTGLALSRSKASWIRMWDFPRLQLAVLGSVTLVVTRLRRRRHASIGTEPPPHGAERAPPALPRVLEALLTAATAYQWMRVWRYTPIAPREVERASRQRGPGRLSIAEANVMLDNRDPSRLIALFREISPDILVCVETDRSWCDALRTFAGSHPHQVAVPLDNSYGMMLLSRLPLHDVEVEYLTDPCIPSVSARVELRDGTRVRLHCLHPRPPSPDKTGTSLQRDSELMIVGARVRDEQGPVVVCGDLNDVAWSRTTRLFQRLSGLLDPRKGRGFYATFNAFTPGFRFPLDHFFHSDDFRLVSLDVLPAIGSDHFPMHIVLSHEPVRGASQEPPERREDDIERAQSTVRHAEKLYAEP